MNPQPNRYAQLFAAYQTLIPGFTARTKEDSPLMHLLAGLLFFNPRFLSEFTTTLGRTVFFPSSAWVKAHVGTIDEVLAHEGVHAFDFSQNPVAFVRAYVLPQILGALPLLVALVAALISPHRLWVLAPLGLFVGAVALAFIEAPGRALVIAMGVLLYLGILGTMALSVWASIPLGVTLLILLLVFVCPWPSVGRTAAELRGYGMSLAVKLWKGEEPTPELIEWVVRQFVGPAYYFMSWSRARITREVSALVDQIRTGAILQGEAAAPYRLVHAELLKGEASTARV